VCQRRRGRGRTRGRQGPCAVRSGGERRKHNCMALPPLCFPASFPPAPTSTYNPDGGCAIVHSILFFSTRFLCFFYSSTNSQEMTSCHDVMPEEAPYSRGRPCCMPPGSTGHGSCALALRDARCKPFQRRQGRPHPASGSRWRGEYACMQCC